MGERRVGAGKYAINSFYYVKLIYYSFFIFKYRKYNNTIDFVNQKLEFG